MRLKWVLIMMLAVGGLSLLMLPAQHAAAG